MYSLVLFCSMQMVKLQQKFTLGRILLLVRILVVDRHSIGGGVLVGNDGIQCTVTVTDGDGATDSNVAAVIVQNTPPVVSNVQVSPSNPLNDETLTCSATVVDAGRHGYDNLSMANCNRYGDRN